MLAPVGRRLVKTAADFGLRRRFRVSRKPNIVRLGAALFGRTVATLQVGKQEAGQRLVQVTLFRRGSRFFFGGPASERIGRGGDA